MSSQENLIENENQTKQSIEIFQNWLSKHPFIKFTGAGNINDIMLHFLRLRKFRMDQTFECFEFFLVFIKSHPQWYSSIGFSDYVFTKQQHSPIIILKNRDSEGRKVVICRMKYLENENNIQKSIRKILVTPILTTFDQQTAESSLILIIDLRGFSFKTFSKVSPKDLNDILKFAKCGLIRGKLMYVIGMPSFMMPIHEALKILLAKKMVDKLQFLENVDELTKLIDLSNLTIEYGGTATELTDFEEFEQGVAFMNFLVDNFDVDCKRIQNFENIGSFRKLDID